jgi:GrpB-like predicted nucleotidyltransferase (UPF0157 family)
MVRIVEPDSRWAGEFTLIAADLRDAVGGDARRIDHIGSTSVPGLPAKDVIDIQMTVADEEMLAVVASALASRGWRRERDIVRDHQVPGLPAGPLEWRKILFDEPEGSRPIHLHIRVDGRVNQRYALLFRDFLRVHSDKAAAYAEVKRGLAALAPDSGSYADAKDSTCDLIYIAAEAWASESGWTS